MDLLFLIHVVAAVVGLGPAFIFPLFIKLSKTREQLVLINGMLEKAEKSIKIGSIMLLLTGLILGFLNPQLFTRNMVYCLDFVISCCPNFCHWSRSKKYEKSSNTS